MKHSIIEATILAVGFIILGFLLKASVDNLSKRDRYVSVKGLSEMEFPADKVTCPLVFKEIGDDLLTIHTNINTKNATIVTFLKSKGIDEKDITIAAPEIIDLQAERYGVEVPENPGLASAPQFASTADACAAGVAAEIADADLYDQLLPDVTHPDLQRVYTNLKNASLQSHLPAFEACK